MDMLEEPHCRGYALAFGFLARRDRLSVLARPDLRATASWSSQSRKKAWCASRPRNSRLRVTTETFQLDQMEVRVVEYEAIVQHRDHDGFPAATSVSVVIKRSVNGVVPEHLVRRGRTGVICNEVRSVEYPGVGTAFGKAVAERQSIEIEHVALAIVPAEVGDVIEAISGRVVDEMIAAAAPGEA